MHSSQAALRKFFRDDYLSEKLQPIPRACAALAEEMLEAMPNGGAELTAGLRKLLEAKDCFIRSALGG